MSQDSSKAFLKYSGLAFQMIVAVGLGFYIGFQIDKWMNLENPWFGIVFSLLFLAAYFYKLIHELNKK